MDIESCLEEQRNEIEVLKSIYFDEFLEIDPDNLRHYALNIRPDESIYAHTLPAEEEYIREYWSFYLVVDCPETYPQDPPQLALTHEHPVDASLSSPSWDLTDPLCPSLERQAALSAFLQVELQANHTPGLVVIFTMVTALQEEMRRVLQLALEDVRAGETARLLEEEQREAAKFYGTPVTREAFISWHRQYLLEHPLIPVHGSVQGKLTGRELFEQDKTLVTSDAVLLGDDDECVDPMAFSESDLHYLNALTLQDDEESSEVTRMLLESKV